MTQTCAPPDIPTFIFNTKPKWSGILIQIRESIQISALIKFRDNAKMYWMCSIAGVNSLTKFGKNG